MLDFNHRPTLSEQISERIDLALQQEQRSQVSRNYLGASRLGVSCDRALQFEFTHTPVDEGRSFTGRTLRIFAAGHVFEELAIDWLRKAGFDLYTETSTGGQFGFSAVDGRLRGHVDGVLAGGPESIGEGFPALWECKSLNAKSWKDTVKRGVTLSKPVYAAQIALYQAYMEEQIPGISSNPALFTAINKDTAELYFEWVPFNGELAQRASDRGVRVIQATDAGELLPRISKDPAHYECKFCSWQDRCWRGGAQ
ncbi:hypothetical protein A3766_00260 [Oleiphilus sp. HI0132]|uniref:hypothetical protein n=1 Tax=Oleiphilus sp. HI0132 TaxID=1822270 RepID=UPI0007C25585|nr:hypothetical protein [Oleiphilus sp. HI0132]KZZ75080.1 hypothetical protein A3766_00260 [Oleiphilus sp. HI0132]